MTVNSSDTETLTGQNGYGHWENRSLVRAETSIGPASGYIDLNINTGAGIRGGNVDVHALGFGTTVGADGVSIDTPIGGAKCVVM